MASLAPQLRRLRSLKKKAEAIGTKKKEADAAFKQHQMYCLDVMDQQETASWRDKKDDTLFTAIDDRVKGQVEDKRKYLRWALENDEGVQEFLQYWTPPGAENLDEFEEYFYNTLMNLSLLRLAEDGSLCNQQARRHIEDKQPLPPGLTFRPDPYVQMRSN